MENPEMDDVTFFDSQAAMEAWLAANHASVAAQWLGFYKKNSGRTGISYPEALDAALCYGWIDGIRKSIDAERYTIRFTPRRRGSYWSAVNTRRIQQLIEQGRVHPSGLAAFAARDPEQTQLYSFEGHRALAGEYVEEFQHTPAAWEFFQSQPESYRRAATGWVMTAKREDTRRKRLATLIADSANGLRIAMLRR